jgi:hypothetical protein
MACVDHVLELGSIATFGDKLVGDGLIIGPPLGSLYVLLRGAYCGGTDGKGGFTSTLRSPREGDVYTHLERTHSQQVQDNWCTPHQRCPKSIQTSGR